jgi:hypothetical protein
VYAQKIPLKKNEKLFLRDAARREIMAMSQRRQEPLSTEPEESMGLGAVTKQQPMKP